MAEARSTTRGGGFRAKIGWKLSPMLEARGWGMGSLEGILYSITAECAVYWS
jgi:hypothetical protein